LSSGLTPYTTAEVKVFMRFLHCYLFANTAIYWFTSLYKPFARTCNVKHIGLVTPFIQENIAIPGVVLCGMLVYLGAVFCSLAYWDA
jgi:hypothetical protein